MIYTGHLALW